MKPKDNFSIQSDLYARYRPHYPEELYGYLNSRIKSPQRAWDCATGNGQVAYKLAESFQNVIATDISQAQLNNAQLHERILYKVASAEKTSITDHSIDLITVGQAIHWFDHKAFYNETKRVSKKGALLAYWSYGLLRVSPDINKTLDHFHNEVLGKYWDPERQYWANEYRDIQLPLEDFERKDFEYPVKWDLGHLEGYLNSWSAVQHCIKQTGHNPVPTFKASLSSLWTERMTVTFPVFLYAGIVH